MEPSYERRGAIECSGQGLARGNDDFLEEGSFLQKPFSRDTLVLKVGEALRNNSKSKT
jgi:hypothetical protein